MPPVVAAVGGAATSFALATGASTAAATAFGTFAGQAFVNIAAGVALSAVSRALAPQPETTSRGTKVSITVGEDQPQSFFLGKYATAGDLLYHGSWGTEGDTPNMYYVQVIELSDRPARFSRVWVNDAYGTLAGTEDDEGRGFAVEEFKSPNTGKDNLWIKFYDGTQTVADPYLVSKFAEEETRPWTSAMIGRGMAYAIVTARYKPEINQDKPDCLFELRAWGLYDRRKDSTASGSGAQRWTDWRTWQPSDNPVVMIDNILRGIRDPITDQFMWGGPNIDNTSKPASVWFAAMNACDETLTLPNSNTDVRYRAGLEVRVDEEPAAIIEELLKACSGEIAVAAGKWIIKVGITAPVYAFTDATMITTATDQFDPFPQLDDAYNEVQAKHPEPEEGWNAKDAPPRKNEIYLAEDGGKRNVADISFKAVPYWRQVQRLMAAALNDGRRFRRHTVVLPPEAQFLSPLDEVSWTSVRYGYSNKKFAIDLVEHLANGTVAVSLRERDPTDYDWDDGLTVPVVPVTPGVVVPRPPQVAAFEVEGVAILDTNGVPRRAAIKLLTTPAANVTGIRYRVFLAESMAQLPANTMANPGDTETVSTETMSLEDDPAALAGVPATYSVLTDVDGEAYITDGILPNEDYLVQILFEPVTTNRLWSELKPVHTPDIRIGEPDLDDVITDKIRKAQEDADAAAADAVAALAAADEATALVQGLSGPVLAQLQTLADQLAGLQTGDVQELMGIAVAGLHRGWAKDPTFNYWTGTAPTWVPTYWDSVGFSTFASKSTAGFYPSSLLLTIPTGTHTVYVRGSSLTANQLPAADFAAPYVVMGVLLRVLSGSATGAQARIEWHRVSSGSWIRGHALGQDNSLGLFGTWGFSNAVDRMQSKEVVWEKPFADAADGMRIHFEFKGASSGTSALTMRLDYLDVRGATEGEIAGYVADEHAEAAINQFAVTITGPGGALAALQTSLRAEFAAADASIVDTFIVVGGDTTAMAGRITTLEARFGGQNFVQNPIFEDGFRAVGEEPDWWDFWPVTFTVIPRDPASGISALANAPTRFVAKSVYDASIARVARAHGPQPIVPGEKLNASFRCAGFGTNFEARMSISVRFIAADKLTTVSLVTKTHQVQAPPTWRKTDFAVVVDGGTVPPFTAPAGAGYFETYIRREIGGGNPDNFVLFTNVEVTKVEDVAYARASESLVASSTASAAVAAWDLQVRASFADFNSMVHATAAAVATTDKAASAFVIRATAGGGSAGLRIVAWDNDEVGSGGAVVLDGDNVIAPGTMSVGTLVVTDLGHNMVPDDQIQSGRDWTGADFFVIPNSTDANPDSIGEMRYNHTLGTIARTTSSGGISQAFPVRPGQRLQCTYQARRLGGTRMVARIQLQWYDRSGVAISPTNSTFGDLDTTTTNLLTATARVIVPATARRCRFQFVAMPGTDSSIRFFSPSVISNEDASVLITPDGAFFNELTAQTLWVGTANIKDLNVSRIKVGTGAVSNQSVAFRLTDTAIPGDSAFITVLTTSITKTADEAAMVHLYLELVTSAQFQWSAGLTTTGITDWRMTRNGNVIWTTAGAGNDFLYRQWFPDVSNFSGLQTYAFQVRLRPGSPSPGNTGATLVGQIRNLVYNNITMAISQVVK
jgi:hypothetical protein